MWKLVSESRWPESGISKQARGSTFSHSCAAAAPHNYDAATIIIAIGICHHLIGVLPHRLPIHPIRIGVHPREEGLYPPASVVRPHLHEMFPTMVKQTHDFLGISHLPAEHHQAGSRHGFEVTDQVRQHNEKL